MIKVSNLTKKFEDVTAINNLSIEIRPGVNGLMGENGAGKSTLLRLISAIYVPTDGEVTINEHPADSLEAKNTLFFLSDNPYYPRNADIKTCVSLYASLFPLDVNKAIELIDKFKLPKGRRVNNYSKGMRRQLFIAIALAMDCSYILLDEAFDGVDPMAVEVIKQEIKEQSKTKTFIIASHSLTSLEGLCDNFILLHKGKLSKEGNIVEEATTYQKYQILFDKEVNESDIISKGYPLSSLTRIGSISHLIFNADFDIDSFKKDFSCSLFEKINIDDQEVFKENMRKEKDR